MSVSTIRANSRPSSPRTLLKISSVIFSLSCWGIFLFGNCVHFKKFSFAFRYSSEVIFSKSAGLPATIVFVFSPAFSSTVSLVSTPLLQAVMAAKVNVAAHTNIIIFIVSMCLLFVFDLLFLPCNFASHHCKTLLQSCKSVSHHCIGHCTAAKRPRTTAKRIYSIAKRSRTIAKRFCSIVSCPCSGAGHDCTAFPSALLVAMEFSCLVKLAGHVSLRSQAETSHRR